MKCLRVGVHGEPHAVSTRPKDMFVGEIEAIGTRVAWSRAAMSVRAASTGRNPQTGEAMQIKASNQAKFKPGKGLKDAINA